jgi:hypothetical protein
MRQIARDGIEWRTESARGWVHLAIAERASSVVFAILALVNILFGLRELHAAPDSWPAVALMSLVVTYIGAGAAYFCGNSYETLGRADDLRQDVAELREALQGWS